MSDDPSKPLEAVESMRRNWDVIDPLMGGTLAMREAGNSLLEQFEDEDKTSFDRRLKHSTLLPAYSETVSNMTGRVFADDIVVGDDTPDVIKGLTENIDRQGNNLQVWAKTFFASALAYGLCHVLVEYPKTTDADGNPTIVTKADEQAAGVRPYTVMVRPQQVIGWRSDSVGGEHVLTQFRYMESVDENDGEFGVKSVKQIRVLVPGAWATYREIEAGGKKTWTLHEKGTSSLQVIPLTTFYTNRTGFMTATPPLMELAHLNVKHWNEQSDQDKSTRFSRIRLAVIIGVDDSEISKIKISSDSMLSLPVNADIKVVQGSAESVAIGRSELTALLDDMRMSGAKLLQKDKQAVKTATQAEDEAAQELSPLETMASQLEDALDQVLQFFAKLTGNPEGGHVQVNGNFDSDFIPETTLPLLLNLATQGKISDETLFSELQRRNVVSQDIDWEEEKAKIAEQGPSLGAL